MGRWVPHFVADAGWLKTVSQTGVEALIDLHHAQAPAVLDNSRTLPQGGGRELLATHVLGKRGIEVIGANRKQKIKVP